MAALPICIIRAGNHQLAGCALPDCDCRRGVSEFGRPHVAKTPHVGSPSTMLATTAHTIFGTRRVPVLGFISDPVLRVRRPIRATGTHELSPMESGKPDFVAVNDSECLLSKQPCEPGLTEISAGPTSRLPSSFHLTLKWTRRFDEGYLSGGVVS